jgi:hypothetical protein
LLALTKAAVLADKEDAAAAAACAKDAFSASSVFRTQVLSISRHILHKTAQQSPKKKKFAE